MSSFHDAESVLLDWEKYNGEIKPKKVRNVVKNLAEINLNEKRGFTRDDIHFKDKIDDKRAIIYRLLQRGIILPLPEKLGRLSQYVLSNIYDYIASTSSDNRKTEEPIQTGLIDRIAEYFSKSDNGIHNIHMNIQTRVAKDYNIYDYLKTWSLDKKNKGKSKMFVLEPRRRFTVIVYPNGSILVNFNCSTKSFKLSQPSGLIEFFSSLGEIRSILVGEFQSSYSQIPPCSDWWLTQYDIDSTVAANELEEPLKVSVSSSLRNSIQIRMLGHLFYLYVKEMPNQGTTYRFEERMFPQKKPLVEETKEILESESPFTKAINLLDKKEGGGIFS
ncbi:hypothetical protein BH23THE1_BH23THE1_26390 [soil metagenome]